MSASISGTRLMPHSRPQEPRVPRRAPGIHQNREFHIFHACPIAPSVCCNPAESRVPRVTRRASGIHQNHKFHVSHACSPAFVATLRDCRAFGVHQNREFHIFHACPQAPSVCCAPSELRVPASSTRALWRPAFDTALSQVHCVCRAPGIHKNREFLVSHARSMASSV